MDLWYTCCWSYAAVSALCLDHDFHKEVKAGRNSYKSQYYCIFFWGHPVLTKYCTVWATFSRYFLLNTFSMASAIWIVNAYIRHYSHFLAKYKSPQLFDCRENWLTESTSFLRTTILSVYIYNYHLSWVLTGTESTLLGNLTIRDKSLFGWLGLSPSFGKDSDVEVVIELLTAVV